MSGEQSTVNVQTVLKTSPYLDLLVGGDRTEDDLSEPLGRKHPEADAPNHSAIFDE